MPSIDIIKLTIPPENMTGATAIVTSANAAHSAMENGFIFDDVKLLAVGAATTRSFTQKGYTVRWTAEPANSEGVVEILRSAEDCQDTPFFLLTGVGGRNLIQDYLVQSDLQFRRLDLYRRQDYPFDRGELDRLSSFNGLVTVGSNESLSSFHRQLGTRFSGFAENPLVVNSERGRQHALSLGWQGDIYVPMTPGDTGQLACIGQWLTKFEV